MVDRSETINFANILEHLAPHTFRTFQTELSTLVTDIPWVLLFHHIPRTTHEIVCKVRFRAYLFLLDNRVAFITATATTTTLLKSSLYALLR